MIIRTSQDREAFIVKLDKLKLDKPWQVTAEVYKPKRSVAMNSLLYAWYASIAKYRGVSQSEQRGEFKWEFGVPILLARGEEEFDNLINSIVNSLQYEQIVKLFGTDAIQVTSVFKVPEMLEYLTAIEHYCYEGQIPLLKGDEYNYAMTGEK